MDNMQRRRHPVGTFLVLLLLLGMGPATGTPASAAEATGDVSGTYLYRVTTLRAEPGKLPELIAYLVDRRGAARAGTATEHAPVIMRHSQGDQWDLLLLMPMDSYASYYSARRHDDAAEFQSRLDALSSFREDLFAYGPPPGRVAESYAENAFFHIEMFYALAGRKEELIDERKMENAYLKATNRRTNMIWVGDTGSDVDVFTIGFYPSIVEFAAPSGVSDDDANQAAIDAGFEARSTISTYLRELISSHHDTLATKVE